MLASSVSSDISLTLFFLTFTRSETVFLQFFYFGPGGRDRTLAVKVAKTLENQLFFRKKLKLPKKDKIYPPKNIFFVHISSSHDKILG